jgi:hypothetical protein
MSKWVNTEKFEEFKNERQNDTSDQKNNVTFARKYPNPKMGSLNSPKEYHVRLVPDTKGSFYKKIYYHMFQSGESWNFIMCPKTEDFECYCPWCALTQTLYQGNDADKKRAYTYKRKEKFVGNVYVVKDPRDADQNDPDRKLTGKTFLYEFPSVIEQLIKKEVTDVENGWGFKIFDPEDGHNLIISIGAKKADKNGKVWPDYSLTTFSKRPSSIGENVDEVMETTQDIMEYVDKSMKTNEEHAEMLKSEMLFDDVKEQFERFMPIGGKTDEGSAPQADTPKEDKPSSPSEEPEKKKSDETPIEEMGDDDIDNLLKDL